MELARLRQARADLIQAALIAYERPLYQVLELYAPVVVLGPELNRDEQRERLARLRAILEGTQALR